MNIIKIIEYIVGGILVFFSLVFGIYTEQLWISILCWIGAYLIVVIGLFPRKDEDGDD